MSNTEIFIATVMEDSWLTLEQLAAACQVEQQWLNQRIDDGLFPGAQSVAGTWRFSRTSLLRAQRMLQLERNFEAVPELAALVTDLQDELDALRRRLRRYER